jgi:hypothetical protein
MKITRRQLRKLIMESLGGAQSSILKEFYHATTFPVESFLSGIQIDKAKGFGQGAGFYVYTKKSRAIAHARDITNPNSQIEKQIEYSGDDGSPKIVVIDPPLTPENFAIDYEWMSHKLVDFAMENKEQFIGLTVLYEGEAGSYPYEIFNVKNVRGRNVMFFKGGETGRNRMSLSGVEGTIRDGRVFSAVANSMVEQNPNLFRQFEESVLENVDVLKYNGEKVIIPLRIEDLEGNILWKRSFAQSFL